MKPALAILVSFIGFAACVRGTATADLIRLYEEEILARELYSALGRRFPDIMPFRNIPRSEERHRKALAAVLRKEGIALPKPENGRRFVSPDLDAIYRKWLAEGRRSEKDACRVGVRLEEHDITDLRAAQVAFPKHKEVFGRLEVASNNHLRAFHRNLVRRDGKYRAEALSQAGFDAIVGEESARGCGQGGCGGCDGNSAPAGGNGSGKREGSANGKGRGYRGGR